MIAFLCVPIAARAADERGGNFDIVLEGGVLVGSKSSASDVHIAPLAQVTGMGRYRVAEHLALAGGLSLLPAPNFVTFGLVGHLEWLPLHSEPLSLAIVLGSRLMIVQPLMCLDQSMPSPPCGPQFSSAGGIVGEIGIAVRSDRLGGYRLGASLSALAGPMTPYGEELTLRDLYVGGLAGLIVTF